MKVNVVGKEYSEATRAYAAGFLDADGAIMAPIEKHQEKKFKFRVRIIVKMTQKNYKHVKWFTEIFDFGRLQKNRETYDWLIKDQKKVRYFLLLIKPYVKVKEKQLILALKILDKDIKSEKDLISIAQLADTLSKFNVRSAKRRINNASMIKEYFSRNDLISSGGRRN